MPVKSLFLQIDDDETEMQFVAREFAKARLIITLLPFTSGREAVRYLRGEGKHQDRSQSPLPDVILLDLKMPDFDGFDFLKWLREADYRLRLTPVIVVSDSAVPDDVRRAYALGANSYCLKPVDPSEFAKRIQILGLYWAEHAEKPPTCPVWPPNAPQPNAPPES
jgi:CheY-like chemotaxis protein